MKRQLLAAVFCVLATTTRGDSFGTFDIDFVTISGNKNPASGYGIVNKDYRIGTYEITNGQWNKFKAAYGTVTGTPADAYNSSSSFTGANVPVNNVSWYAAAQFVNWLNTSTGHTAAYKFTGTIHTSSYTLGIWSSQDADGTNLYRNKNAKYFLPTENEWVKAAYWNGTNLQTYATKAGESVYQGNGSNGGWDYYGPGWATNPYGPWTVGSGNQELNGTYDMMGNVWEWMENPFYTGQYTADAYRGHRGGSWGNYITTLTSSSRLNYYPYIESYTVGFRVASVVPEPCSLTLLFLGGLALRYRKR